jgi:hypothetical protein
MLNTDMFDSFQMQDSNELLVSQNKYGVLVLNNDNEWVPTEITEEDFPKYNVIVELLDYENGEDLKASAEELGSVIAPMWPMVEEVDKFIPSI